MLEATLLENVDPQQKVSCKEGVRPGRAAAEVHDFDEALARSTTSKFGLQAGMFTRDILKVLDAWDGLDVGGVVINDVPSATASTTCLMAASRIRASAAKASASRWRT